MQLINFRLLVGDIAASTRFWRDVMQLSMKYGDEAMGYAYFETSSAGIELMRRDAAAPAPAGPPAAIVFNVDNVDASYAELVARGATSISGPQDYAEYGVRSAQFGDPDGYLVEIYTYLPKADVSAA